MWVPLKVMIKKRSSVVHIDNLVRHVSLLPFFNAMQQDDEDELGASSVHK